MSSSELEADVLTLRILVALDQVGAFDDLVVRRAVHLVLDPIAALFVKLVELHAFRAGRGVDLERDRHETERQGPRADGAGGHLAYDRSHLEEWRSVE